MARVVHGADMSEDVDATPESAGLKAVADGFALLDVDDQRQLALELPVYDALYAWAEREVTGADAAHVGLRREPLHDARELPPRTTTTA
jgi:hypothetical protein